MHPDSHYCRTCGVDLGRLYDEPIQCDVCCGAERQAALMQPEIDRLRTQVLGIRRDAGCHSSRERDACRSRATCCGHGSRCIGRGRLRRERLQAEALRDDQSAAGRSGARVRVMHVCT